MKFFTLFHFLTRFMTSKYLKLLSKNLGGEMERWEKRAFQLLKMRKKNQLKHKNHVHNNRFLTVRSSRMKDYTCHFEVRI